MYICISNSAKQTWEHMKTTAKKTLSIELSASELYELHNLLLMGSAHQGYDSKSLEIYTKMVKAIELMQRR